MSFSILRPLYPTPTRSGGSLVSGQLLTVTSTAAVTVSGLNAGTRMCMFDVKTADVYATVDGNTPSSTAGHTLTAGNSYTWSSGMMNAAKFVATGTTNSLIWVSELQD